MDVYSQMWPETLVGKLDLKAFPVSSSGILDENWTLFVLDWLLLADKSEGEDI